MGWFSSSESKPEVNNASRTDRQKCWEARDGYFACLDNASVIKAGGEGNACAVQAKAYEENCAKSWIDYFNQRRIIAEAQKGRLEQAQMQARDASR